MLSDIQHVWYWATGDNSSDRSCRLPLHARKQSIPIIIEAENNHVSLRPRLALEIPSRGTGQAQYDRAVLKPLNHISITLRHCVYGEELNTGYPIYELSNNVNGLRYEMFKMINCCKHSNGLLKRHSQFACKRTQCLHLIHLFHRRLSSDFKFVTCSALMLCMLWVHQETETGL